LHDLFVHDVVFLVEELFLLVALQVFFFQRNTQFAEIVADDGIVLRMQRKRNCCQHQDREKETTDDHGLFELSD